MVEDAAAGGVLLGSLPTCFSMTCSSCLKCVIFNFAIRKAVGDLSLGRMGNEIFLCCVA